MVEQQSAGSAEPISWRAVVYGTPVIDSAGERVGVIREVLGSDAEDIFHGLRVRVGATSRDVMVPAGQVASLETAAVRLSVERSAVEALPDFDEPATYHLSSVGWLRKHIGWRADADSDEEPG